MRSSGLSSRIGSSSASPEAVGVSLEASIAGQGSTSSGRWAPVWRAERAAGEACCCAEEEAGWGCGCVGAEGARPTRDGRTTCGTMRRRQSACWSVTSSSERHAAPATGANVDRSKLTTAPAGTRGTVYEKKNKFYRSYNILVCVKLILNGFAWLHRFSMYWWKYWKIQNWSTTVVRK